MAEPLSEFERYREHILATLGDHEPLSVLRTTLNELEQLVGEASADQLRRPTEPGEWSPWQVLAHMADAEPVFGIRIRLIVMQERPTIIGFDQEAWTERFATIDRDPRETFTRWQVQRRHNIRLYESLSADEWQRIGMHAERGPESAYLTVQLVAGHDLVHIDQLRRGLGA